MGNKVNRSQWCSLAAQKASTILDNVTSRLREVILPLYSVLKSESLILCSQCKGDMNILDRVQQREHGYDEGPGACFLWGKAESWNCSAQQREKAQGDLSNVYQYLMGGVKKTEPECAQLYTFARTRDKGHRVKDGNFHLNRRKKRIHSGGGPHSLWSLRPWRLHIQNPSGRNPDQSALGGASGEGRVD